MKALSLRPYWASLVAVGDKTIEARSWKTNYRGDLLICSSTSLGPGERGILPSGVALAIVNLVDIVPYDQQKHSDYSLFDDEYEGYAWILDNIRPIKPVKVKGKLHIFDVEIEPEYLLITGSELFKYWYENGITTIPLI